VDKVRAAVARIYRGAKVPSSHDYSHAVRVARLARAICRAVGVGGREAALAEIASYLHDVAVALGGKEGHADQSAEEARRILAEAGLCEACVEAVTRAIAEHSWAEGRRPTSIVSAVLQDADRLDALGVVGFARMVAYGSWIGRMLHHPAEVLPRGREPDENAYTVDHAFTKLASLPSAMNFEWSRRVAEARLNRLMRLLEELEREAHARDLDWARGGAP